MDDSALAARAAAGDHGAFAALLDRHGGRVLAVATRIAGDRTLAEDLCQDVWIHLLRVLPKYDPARPFAPWLVQVAANLCRNRVRGERRRPARSLAAMEDDAGDFIASTDAPPEARIERDETARIVRAARDALPPSYREILALRYEGDLSHEEISEALGGLPIGTVKNRLHRAREALALVLDDALGEEER
jgi:RNA polymerase sigma-70 factor (ECF subfamily)